MTSNIRTLEQQRALRAFQLVTSVGEETRDKYKSHVKSIPALIQSNGLGQTLAFFKSKSDYRLIYDHLQQNLKDTGIIREDALKEIMDMDIRKYMWASAETLRFVNWLRRFVDSELGTGKTKK